MQQIPTEQIQQSVQVLLSFLDSDGASVPGNMLEGIVSGKSILRGLLSGNLGLVSLQPAPEVKSDKPGPVAKKKKAAKGKPVAVKEAA